MNVVYGCGVVCGVHCVVLNVMKCPHTNNIVYVMVVCVGVWVVLYMVHVSWPEIVVCGCVFELHMYCESLRLCDVCVINCGMLWNMFVFGKSYVCVSGYEHV